MYTSAAVDELVKLCGMRTVWGAGGPHYERLTPEEALGALELLKMGAPPLGAVLRPVLRAPRPALRSVAGGAQTVSAVPVKARVPSGIRPVMQAPRPAARPAPNMTPQQSVAALAAPSGGYRPAPVPMSGKSPTLVGSENNLAVYESLSPYVKKTLENSDLVRAGVPPHMAMQLAYMGRQRGENLSSAIGRHVVTRGRRVPNSALGVGGPTAATAVGGGDAMVTKVGAFLPILFQLEKRGMTVQDARSSLERLDSLNLTRGGELARSAGLGALAGPLVGMASRKVTGGRVPSSMARQVLGDSLVGATYGGGLPFIRNQMERGVERQKLKDYLETGRSKSMRSAVKRQLGL